MIPNLRPYPTMKDSGVEWLGEVPEHWEVMPLRRVTTSKCDGPFGSGLKSSHYSDEGVRVVRLQNIGQGEFKDRDAAYIDEDYYGTLGDHSVNGGDILIAGLGDDRHPTGRACVAPQAICPAMVKADCFRFRLDGDRCVSKFLALQLTSTANVASAVLSRGATRQRVNLQSTSTRSVSFPSPAEQTAVVRYLNYVERRVQRLVRAKRKLLALLTEQKQAIIHRAVTRGLDPDVPMKDSGVEWLGKVPKHWEVQSARKIGRVQGGKALAASAPGLQMPYLRVANVFDGRVEASQTNTMPFTDAEFERYRLKNNDLLLNEGQSLELVGRTARYVGNPPNVAFQNSLIRVQVYGHADSKFIELLFRHAQHHQIFAIVATQTTNIAHLGVSRLANLVFALPPLAEQRDIVTHINSVTPAMNTTISRVNDEIDLLNEYRTRLIADVVTGKLDVREAAAALPEVDPLTADDGLNSDADPDLAELDNIPEEAEA